MLKTIKHASALTAVAGLLQLTSISAQAAPTTPVASQSVSYADLDLSTAEGVDALSARIKIAAESVCKRSTNNLGDFARERDCRREAIADGMNQVRDQTSGKLPDVR